MGRCDHRQVVPETDDALKLMLDIQKEGGTWGSLDCWPPYESDAYHLATVAAMAVATAPGWLEAQKDEKVLASVESLKKYLRETPPLHDYSRVLLLWASTRMKGLIDESQQATLATMLAKKQHADGGWSIRDFAQPEQWGKGNRADKLKAEPEFKDPPSDGHMTGLAIVVLRARGVAKTDAGLQKGVAWIKSNQRESGRWWTRSLNTDTYHFITYSGTAFRCGRWPCVTNCPNRAPPRRRASNLREQPQMRQIAVDLHPDLTDVAALNGAAAVAIDVLRATTTIAHALAASAREGRGVWRGRRGRRSIESLVAERDGARRRTRRGEDRRL